MSKSKFSKHSRDYEDWNEDDYGRDPKMHEKRKQKRLTNVLRSKNIDELLELEEDDC